ncbi:MAG: glutamine synthetase family protein [Desulfohalobiaceae bacterium]|nr:glutamine synthetase family protein [Desulfohalobiaceae bacterium]MCF8106141.1 glutamine synthetase family protein [Desulfohalobiaceae bacterium]
MNAEQILQIVNEKSIELIRFVYTDNDGVIRGYAASADVLKGDLQKGHNFASAMPFFSVLDDLVPASRFGCTGEISGLPDPESFQVIPYTPKTAMVICDFRNKDDHSYSQFCPRSLLKQYLAKLDCEANVAIENEFYLLVKDEQGNYAPFDQSRCFSTSGMNQQQEVAADIVRSLKKQGMTVEKYYPEYGRGQMEIVYSYSHALETADNQIFFRETVKGVAHNHGLIASFMPKPFAGFPGSGAHLHFSLQQNGENIFYDPSDANGLSQTARYFIGGLLEHMPACCAFTASTVNSYKRLLPHCWASAYNCWGIDNREAAIRICPGPKGNEASAFNLEIKPADPACNPYLAVFACLAAGMDGISRRIDPGEPVWTDPYELTPEERHRLNISRLPTTLKEAVDALATDELYRTILGDDFLQEYMQLKRFAWDKYIEHVSDWETALYMEAF